MLSIAISTLRARWVSFAGSFAALTLGVALLSSVTIALTGTADSASHTPRRFAAAPIVVHPAAALPIPGSGYTDHLPLTGTPSVPSSVVMAARSIGRTVIDRSFYAQVAGVPTKVGIQPTGHGWSAAAFTPYRLTAGRAPVADNEVVIGGGIAAQVGKQLSVITAAGPATYTVSGVTAPTSFEQAVFFTDAKAAALSPRVDALVVYGSASALRDAVTKINHSQPASLPTDVLTGDARHDADPTKAGDDSALLSVTGLLGVTAALAGFVSIFLVGSTFAFSVAQRQQEFALLRTAGGTPNQVRFMVLAEAGVIGVFASIIGTVLGMPGGPLLARWLVSRHEAPPWYRVIPSLLVAGVMAAVLITGVLVAMTGAGLACLRAGRVRPIEALRTSVVDRKSMTVGRGFLGISALVIGVCLVGFVRMIDPLVAVGLSEGFAVVLIFAFAMLAPLVITPLVRLVTLPLAWSRGATVMLVRQNTILGVRRTAATAVPVLVTIGLAAALLGTLGTLNSAKSSELRRSSSANYTIVPDASPGITQDVVKRVAALPGLDSTPITSLQVYGPQRGSDSLVEYQAQSVRPDSLGTLFNLTVKSGSLANLRTDTIVIDQEWGKKVGDSISVVFGDGTRSTLTVAAVLRTGVGGNAAFITPDHVDSALTNRIDVRVPAGQDQAAAGTQLAVAVRGLGARVLPSARWADTANRHQASKSNNNATTVLLILMIYSGLATANTLIMSTSARRREFASLRLSGATPRQILRMVTAESLLVVLGGIVLAAAATAICLAGLRVAISDLVASAHVVIPWATLGELATAITAAALAASVVPTCLALRGHPIELAGFRE